MRRSGVRAYIVRGGALQEEKTIECPDRASAIATAEALRLAQHFDRIEANVERSDASGRWQVAELIALYQGGHEAGFSTVGGVTGGEEHKPGPG